MHQMTVGTSVAPWDGRPVLLPSQSEEMPHVRPSGSNWFR
jgi:hypothetical protein